jgi:hypothetical protein
MTTKDLKKLISSLEPSAAFQPPADVESIRRIEAALGVALPDELRSFLRQCDGVKGAHGVGLVWPATSVLEQNQHFRTFAEFRDLYMPFDPLLFFADAGSGDQFAYRICGGKIIGNDVFVWDHETDSRTWVAPNLERYLEWTLTGKLEL